MAVVEEPGRFCQRVFEAEFLRIQAEYRRRRQAFDALFHHKPRNPLGSFAYRWEKALERLERTDPKALSNTLRAAIYSGLDKQRRAA